MLNLDRPRGFAAIGLDRCKCTHNLGGVLRAAMIYDAASVHISGGRMGKYSTDVLKTWRHIPCTSVDDVWAAVPFGARFLMLSLFLVACVCIMHFVESRITWSTDRKPSRHMGDWT